MFIPSFDNIVFDKSISVWFWDLPILLSKMLCSSTHELHSYSFLQKTLACGSTFFFFVPHRVVARAQHGAGRSVNFLHWFGFSIAWSRSAELTTTYRSFSGHKKKLRKQSGLACGLCRHFWGFMTTFFVHCTVFVFTRSGLGTSTIRNYRHDCIC